MLENGTSPMAISGKLGYRKLSIAQAVAGLSAHYGVCTEGKSPAKQLTWMKAENINVDLIVKSDGNIIHKKNIRNIRFGGVTIDNRTSVRSVKTVELIASRNGFYWNTNVTWGNMGND